MSVFWWPPPIVMVGQRNCHECEKCGLVFVPQNGGCPVCELGVVADIEIMKLRAEIKSLKEEFGVNG